MRFQHSARIWADFPELVPVVVRVDDVSTKGDPEPHLRAFEARARARLQDRQESEFPEIQAWRRAFGRMGVKPTQYRCASEALLRRFRKEDHLPRIHPLVDLCNAVSLAFAVPIAVLDLGQISGDIDVTYADGTETYTTFGGEQEHPASGEVVFTDGDDVVHARRWTNRQSGRSAVGAGTHEALIVAEALHDSAARDIPQLGEELAHALADATDRACSIGSVSVGPTVLTSTSPRFAA